MLTSFFLHAFLCAAFLSQAIESSDESASSPSAEVANTPTWKLRYRFEEGQKLRYETRQNMTLKATLGEAKRVDYSELKQRRLFTIQELGDDGSARIAMQFEHVWMQKKVDSQEAVTFDSDMKPADVPMAFRQVARELKGSAPKYWLSSLGISMYPMAFSGNSSTTAGQKGDDKGSEKQAEKTVISLVEGETEKDRIQLVSGSTDATPQEKKNQMDPGSFLMTLPEGEIRVGETWKETIHVPVRLQNDINIQVPILRTFRLEAVDNGIARITFRCSVQTSMRNVTVASQLIQATPRGTISFDIEKGMMLRREMHYDESVFGALGAESLLTSTGTSVEELLEQQASATPAAK